MFSLLEKGPFACGETPLWDNDLNSVFWVDAAVHKVFRLELTTGNIKSYSPHLPITAIRKGEKGTFYLLTKWGLYCWSVEGGEAGSVISGHDFLDPADTVRFNDGVPIGGGGFIAGTFDEADLTNDRGSFYRLNLDGSLETLDSGLHVTNGVAVSQGGRFYYLSEMYRNRVLRYEVANNGNIIKKSIHIELNADEGKPDGLLCDQNNNLWIAHWLGWKLSCWSEEGERLKDVPAPVASPTCFCFADEMESSMVITSATLELSEADLKNGPDAGGLFSLRLY